MRKDPPFDSEYFYATHLLEQAEREGARVFNKPARCATTRRSSRSWSSRSFSPDAGHAREADGAALPRGNRRHHPQAAGRHGRHGHLPRRGRRPEPGLHHRDAQPDGATTIMVQRFVPEIAQATSACW
jgi:glutathione synthase